MWLPCRTSSLGGELHVARGLKEHWGLAQRWEKHSSCLPRE